MFFVLIGFVFCTMTYGQSQFEANVTEHVESNVTQEKSNERQTSDVRKATSQDQGHRAEYYIKNVSHTFADNKSLGRTLIVNFDLNVNGCKGRSLYFIGELEYLDNGTWKPKYSAPALSYVNSRTGQVTAISPDYQCNDDAAEKSGIVLPIPARRISHPEGTEQYRLVIYMMDNNGAGRYPYKDNGSYPEYRFSVDWGYKNPQVPLHPSAQEMYDLGQKHSWDFNGWEHQYFAFDWYRASANAGHEYGITQMYSAYCHGYEDIISPSLDQAEKWINKGIENNLPQAEAWRECVNSLKKYRSGRTLSADDCFYLADFYSEGGFGEAEDHEKSILFIEKAARLGLEDAEEEKAHFYTLAAIHYSDADLDRSLYYARKALELTNSEGTLEAIESLAVNILQDGEDSFLDKDYPKAFNQFRVAAALGNADALAEIATMYGFGLGVYQDYDKAYSLMNSAIAMGFNDVWDVRGEFKSKIDARRYEALRIQQQNEEERYRQNNRKLFSSILTVGAIVAGVAIICNAFDNVPSKPSPSYQSSASKTYTYSRPSSYSSSPSSGKSKSSTGSILDRTKTVQPTDKEEYITDLYTDYRLKGGSLEMKNGHSYGYKIRVQDGKNKYMYTYMQGLLSASSPEFNSFEEMVADLEDFDFKRF